MGEAMKLKPTRNRDRYPISITFSPTNMRPIQRDKYWYSCFPNTVYPFNYYKLELFVSKAITCNSNLGLAAWRDEYRVTEKTTGYFFGKEWDTPEKAKTEAIKILRKVKKGKSNYERALEGVKRLKK